MLPELYGLCFRPACSFRENGQSRSYLASSVPRRSLTGLLTKDPELGRSGAIQPGQWGWAKIHHLLALSWPESHGTNKETEL